MDFERRCRRQRPFGAHRRGRTRITPSPRRANVPGSPPSGNIGIADFGRRRGCCSCARASASLNAIGAGRGAATAGAVCAAIQKTSLVELTLPRRAPSDTLHAASSADYHRGAACVMTTATRNGCAVGSRGAASGATRWSAKTVGSRSRTNQARLSPACALLAPNTSSMLPAALTRPPLSMMTREASRAAPRRAARRTRHRGRQPR
jgi:hypothetical protein